MTSSVSRPVATIASGPTPQAPLACVFRVDGMECAGCAVGLQRALAKLPQVEEASVDFAAGRAWVVGNVSESEVIKTIEGRGFTAISMGAERGEIDADLYSDHSLSQSDIEAKQRQREAAWRKRAIVGLSLWIPLELLHWLGHGLLHRLGVHGPGVAVAMDSLMLAGASIALVIAGSGFFASAWRAALRWQSNMDTLVSMGVLTAYSVSLVTYIAQRLGHMPGAPLWFAEAAALLGIISLGHWLEARATSKASGAVRELLSLQPEEADVLRDGAEARIPSRAIKLGEQVRIRPGGRVPVDGIIRSGQTAMDERSLTGEPLPVKRGEGDAIRAGCVVLDGAITLEATVPGHRTSLDRIALLVQRAQSSRAPVQRLADQISSIFVPSVLAIALLTVIIWSILGDPRVGVLAATTVLVISCPCALGIATPMAIMVGTGEGSRRGILIKDAATLERASSLRTVLFDKTGTLTTGEPSVTSVEIVPPATREEVLTLAASVEAQSEHPIGRAIVRQASREGITPRTVTAFLARPGEGVEASIDGLRVAVLRDAVHSCRVERDGVLIGQIAVADSTQPSARKAVAELIERGLEVHMLTGDRAKAARAVADEIGLDAKRVHADQTPATKIDVVRSLGTGSLMVGDGINDAGALAAADVGVAMGRGAAVAIEAAPVVLLTSDPRAVARLVDLARLTMRCVRRNLAFAFVYNALAIPLAAFGLLGSKGPLVAAAAMALSDICVVGSTLLLKARLSRDRFANDGER